MARDSTTAERPRDTPIQTTEQPRKHRRETIIPGEDNKTINDFLEAKSKADLNLFNDKSVKFFIETTKESLNNLYEYEKLEIQYKSDLLALEQDKAQLEDEKAQLIEEVSHLEARQRLSATPLPACNSSPKSTKLPDPPVFSGDGTQDFEDWLDKMRTKLEVNADHYPTATTQKAYVVSRVNGVANRHLAPRLRKDSNRMFTTAEEIFLALEQVYVDPHRSETAATNFRRLYQGARDFNTFWLEFQQWAAELDYTQSMLCTELRARVNDDLQAALINEINVVTVYELASKCQLYERNIVAVRARHARRTPRNPAPANLVSASRPQLAAGNTPAVLAASASPRPGLSYEMRSKLMTENKCFYCKEAGHRAVECPKKAKRSEIRAVEEATELLSENEKP
jgi:Zinc knuckle